MSSSDLGFENWNPMADDYSSPNFNSYNNEQSQPNPDQDPCSLYVKSVPAAFTATTFQSMFTEYGQIARSRLYPPKPNMSVTCGLVSFKSPSEAQNAIHQLNRRPPHNLEISYAKSTNTSKDPNRGGLTNDKGQMNNVSKGRGQRSQNISTPNITTQHTTDINKNISCKDNSQMNKAPMGRGQRIQIASTQGSSNSFTSNDNNVNSIKMDEPQLNSAPKSFSKGRGQPVQADIFPAIKINLDGNKRIATICNPNENGLQLPKLIQNPNFQCLYCKKPGELSCGDCKKPYCSLDCQENDWQHHKSVCKPMYGKANKCKYDTGYMSECSNSDSERRTSSRPSQSESPKNIPQWSNLQPKSQLLRRKGSRPSKTELGSNSQQLAFIKSNEIECSTLPQNGMEEVYVCNFISPSKLWLHLKSTKALLSEMERKLMETVDKSSVICSTNDICCTVQDGCFFRIKVIEVKPNSVVAEFIDYGGTDTVKSDCVYHLPLMFKKYSSQAICCKLIDANGCGRVQWNNEDFTTLRQYTLDKEWKVKTYNKSSNNIYEISLLNEEGVDWYSIAKSLVEPLADVPESKGSLSKVPSVCENLKVGSEASFAPVESSNGEFWGVLDDAGFAKCLEEINGFLQNIETDPTKDITVSCEEGDLAIGYSNKYEEYYRCVVLKRLRSSFLVLYIDFGNKEEITKLFSVPPALLQKQSYVVCCTKPNSLSTEEFKKIFEIPVKMSVKSITSSVVELTVNSCPHAFQCFPWNHGIPIKSNYQCNKESTSKVIPTRPPSTSGIGSQNNEKIPRSPANQVLPKTGKNIPNVCEKTFIDSISEKTLTVGSKYNVIIIGIISASEIYVQLNEDQQRIISFGQELNQYCLSDTNARYRPSKDEVVCCKYSEDNNWYRAHVMAKSSENMFKVNFIDFGNADDVSEASMKALPKKFTSGKFCICVSLSKVKDEDLKDFYNNLFGKPWVMEVKEASRPVKVMFYQGQKSLLELMDVECKYPKSALKFQKLPTGTTSEVTICFVDGERLYFNQVKDATAIQNLQRRINSGDRKAISGKPEVGNVYCCLEEGYWYRACVNSEISNNTYKVSFVDFGNEEEVSLSNFKAISKDDFALPVYCIAAVSENVDYTSLAISDSSYVVEVIGENAGVQKVKFLNLPQTQQNPSLSVFKKTALQTGINEVIFCYLENTVHYCQLSKDIERLALMFKKLQTVELKPLCKVPKFEDVICAKSIDGNWYRAAIQTIDKTNYKVVFIDYGNSELVSTEKVMLLPDEFHTYPIFCIPLRIKNLDKVTIDFISNVLVEGTGFAADGIQFAEIILPDFGLTNISSLKKQVLPLDSVVEVTLCHAENDVYYAHILSSHESMSTLQLKLKDAATFKSLKGLPAEGDVVCAKFTDGIWYRGSVKKVCSETCEILFIDYGNAEDIALKDLKMPPSEIFAFPVFATPIKITNSEELQKQLQASEVIKVRVQNSIENIQIVELVVPGNEDLSSISTQMLPPSFTEVTVSHREGEKVYVQMISDLESLQEMNKFFLQTNSSMTKIASPKIEQLLCVKFEDGCLYRGLIKEKCGDDFKAFFVDYGNTSIVKEMYSLPSKYSSLPMLSIPVIINNEKELACPVNIDSLCKIKYTGKTIDNVQAVKVHTSIKPVLLSTLKTSSLDQGSFDVCFHSFDGKFHYLNKTSDNSKVNELKTMLKNVSEDEIYHIPNIDEVLLVKCDDLWHRACVKRVNENLKECELFLIDVGTTKCVPYSKISYIPANISSFPIYLIKVSLKYGPIKDTISFGKSYTVTTLDNNSPVPVVQMLQRHMLASLKRKSLPLNEEINVMFIHKENDILFLQDINDAVPLTEVLAEARKCASSEVLSHIPVAGELLCGQSDADGDWYRCCIEDVVGPDKFKIHYIDFGNCEVVSKGNLRQLTSDLLRYPSFGVAVTVVDQLPVTLQQLYPVVAVSEPVNNVQSVKLVMNQKSSDEIPEEVKVDIETQSSPNEQPNSSCVSEPKFLYSSCESVSFSPGEQDIAIYSIHEDNDTCFLFCTPFNRENIADNLGLSDEISEYCENMNCSSYNNISLPEEGEMVLAKFDVDNRWYRAVILEVKDSLFEVIFIDFGNSGKLGIHSMRKMEKKFMSLKIQAILCSLKGFTIKDDNLSIINEELKNFNIFVNPKPLRAIVSTVDDSMVDTAVEIPEITQYLVEKNLVSVDK